MPLSVWDDGRSGPAGCLAGNIALETLFREKSAVRKVKGTVFETPEALVIGRACGSDSYLTPGVLHWANISWDQHLELRDLANIRRRKLKYLFVTAKSSGLSVSLWWVPASLVETVLKNRKKARPKATCGIHIVERENEHYISAVRLTPYYQQIAVDGDVRQNLVKAIREEDARWATSRRRGPRANRPDGVSGQDVSPTLVERYSDTEYRDFEIPLSGGRKANLRTPLPLGEFDVAHIKGWLDLMQDILTEPLLKRVANS